METILLSVHVLLGAAVIGLVLVQQGKGADAGAFLAAERPRRSSVQRVLEVS